jgi:hypothetical protein
VDVLRWAGRWRPLGRRCSACGTGSGWGGTRLRLGFLGARHRFCLCAEGCKTQRNRTGRGRSSRD